MHNLRVTREKLKNDDEIIGNMGKTERRTGYEKINGCKKYDVT